MHSLTIYCVYHRFSMPTPNLSMIRYITMQEDVLKEKKTISLYSEVIRIGEKHFHPFEVGTAVPFFYCK